MKFDNEGLPRPETTSLVEGLAVFIGTLVALFGLIWVLAH